MEMTLRHYFGISQIGSPYSGLNLYGASGQWRKLSVAREYFNVED